MVLCFRPEPEEPSALDLELEDALGFEPELEELLDFELELELEELPRASASCAAREANSAATPTNSANSAAVLKSPALPIEPVRGWGFIRGLLSWFASCFLGFSLLPKPTGRRRSPVWEKGPAFAWAFVPVSPACSRLGARGAAPGAECPTW